MIVLVGGFCAMGAIDNTLNASCRPGGGPTTGGEQAPRVSRNRVRLNRVKTKIFTSQVLYAESQFLQEVLRILLAR